MKMCKQCGSEFTKRRSEAYWQYEKRLAWRAQGVAA